MSPVHLDRQGLALSRAQIARNSHKAKTKDARFRKKKRLVEPHTVHKDLPKIEQLILPSQREMTIDGIRLSIEESRGMYYESLDRDVARCVVVARFYLQHADEIDDGDFDRDFVKRFRRKGSQPLHALKWVLRKAFSDPKKSSRILNAVRVLFVDNVAAEDFPRRVREAGGYAEMQRVNSKQRSKEEHGVVEPTGENAKGERQIVQDDSPCTQTPPEAARHRFHVEAPIEFQFGEGQHHLEDLPEKGYAYFSAEFTRLHDGSMIFTIFSTEDVS